jgi:hypothetical protein
MSDREQSNRPAPEPAVVPDAEADQPIRQVFARRLEAESLARLSAELRGIYYARLETGEGMAPEGENELEHELRAVVVDLRLCAAFLRERADLPNTNATPDHERAWCLLCGARAVEVEAVAERIERMLLHPHSAACPVPPGIACAGIRPEVVQ